MADPTPETMCPHCFQSGFVHVQRVIAATLTLHTLHCKACGYEWEEERGPDDKEKPRSR